MRILIGAILIATTATVVVVSLWGLSFSLGGIRMVFIYSITKEGILLGNTSLRDNSRMKK